LLIPVIWVISTPLWNIAAGSSRKVYELVRVL